MKDVIESILLIIAGIVAVIIVLALVFGLIGLVYWGIGAFIIWAFAINFTWTFWHGLAAGLIISILQGVFTVRIKKED